MYNCNNNDWIFLLSIAKAQNQTNQILKQQMEEAKIKKFDLDLYYSLKAQNEKVAEEYLKYWEQVAEEEKRKAEEAEKQRKIEEQKADEIRVKYVIAGGCIIYCSIDCNSMRTKLLNKFFKNIIDKL